MNPGALITRPREDSEPLALAVERLGFRPLLEPMLEIRLLPGSVPDPAGLRGILLTSANGARALAARLGDRMSEFTALPVWAVGESTAEMAREVGFLKVTAAAGDVTALAGLVAAGNRPGPGAFLHAGGARLAGDLAGLLEKGGLSVRREVFYEAEPATALSAGLAKALRAHEVAVALFFSPRTATSFVRLAIAQDLAGTLAAVDALALSPAVAAALAPIAWRDVKIAERPSQAALLSILGGGAQC